LAIGDCGLRLVHCGLSIADSWHTQSATRLQTAINRQSQSAIDKPHRQSAINSQSAMDKPHSAVGNPQSAMVN
jgi:hypothetical protein